MSGCVSFDCHCKYYDRVNFEGSIPRQLTKMKAEEFDLIIKKRQLSRGEALLKNNPIKAEISCDQVDWSNSLEEELIQVTEDLSFYNDILGEFTTEDIVLLELDFRGDTTQESSVVMITVDVMMTANITADVIILNDVGMANDSCIWSSDQHK